MKVRLSATLKEALREVAKDRGESESVIAREALSFYVSALRHRSRKIRALPARLRDR